MTHSKYDQTLALAGIYQAASLVKQIANTGMANSAHIESSLETLSRKFMAVSPELVTVSKFCCNTSTTAAHETLKSQNTSSR